MSRGPLVALALIFLFSAASARGAATWLMENPGTTQHVPAISTNQTTGKLMAGMSVTAFFSNAIRETAIWTPTDGPDAGAAVGADGDWSLSQSGDTYIEPWRLEYSQTGKGNLISLRLDGLASGVVSNAVLFDRSTDVSGDPYGTPGSQFGRDFVTIPDPYPAGFEINVGYIDQVKLDTDAAGPRGDLYRFLNIYFHFRESIDSVVYGEVGMDGVDVREMIFRQDTDSVSLVPEPAGCLLLGLGTVMAGCCRRRQSTG